MQKFNVLVVKEFCENRCLLLLKLIMLLSCFVLGVFLESHSYVPLSSATIKYLVYLMRMIGMTND